MSKLTKPQAKKHAEACKLLEQDVLSLEERQFVLDHWQESARHVNSVNGAFFTPSPLARDLSIYVGEGSIIDLCAGIGALAFHAIDRFNRTPQRIVCVELNADYVAVGRKVVPEATWIRSDVFDLPADLGTFDYAIANPPFGRCKGVPLSGVPLDLNVVAVAARLARNGVFILPQESCPFVYSGRGGHRPRQSSAYEKLRASVDVVLRCSSIDCRGYRDLWRGVSPSVEITYFDFDEQELEAEPHVSEVSIPVAPSPDAPQLSLFEVARG
ncbi:MAG TPA: methyltransferase domain-containing protein [Thermoanaerobaculia bacterium]|nr:methyltransferase domain-containing protein [Thermoanaerobaculia bacterium]